MKPTFKRGLGVRSRIQRGKSFVLYNQRTVQEWELKYENISGIIDYTGKFIPNENIVFSDSNTQIEGIIGYYVEKVILSPTHDSMVLWLDPTHQTPFQDQFSSNQGVTNDQINVGNHYLNSLPLFSSDSGSSVRKIIIDHDDSLNHDGDFMIQAVIWFDITNNSNRADLPFIDKQSSSNLYTWSSNATGYALTFAKGESMIYTDDDEMWYISTSLNQQTYHLITIKMDDSGTLLRLNGSDAATDPYRVTNLSDTMNLQIGSWDGSRPLNCRFGDILIYNGKVNQGELPSVSLGEDYLKAKWGLN